MIGTLSGIAKGTPSSNGVSTVQPSLCHLRPLHSHLAVISLTLSMGDSGAHLIFCRKCRWLESEVGQAVEALRPAAPTV